MLAPKQYYLIRHGETEFSKTGQHSGRFDLPLTPKGESEAQALRTNLNPSDFSVVLCSPLQRARKTCEIAGFSSVAQIEPDLQEWDYGDHTSYTQEQIRQKYPDWNIWHGPVPNGESIDDIAQRARRILEKYKETEGRIAIFAHGHFLRIFATQYLGLTPQAGMQLAMDPCAVSILGHDAGYPAIRQWNRVY